MDRSLIPPKKYFGFLQPEYVEKRRQALEAYFETLLSTFAENLPKEVLEFLETDKFVSGNNKRKIDGTNLEIIPNLD